MSAGCRRPAPQGPHGADGRAAPGAETRSGAAGAPTAGSSDPSSTEGKLRPEGQAAQESSKEAQPGSETPRPGRAGPAPAKDPRE